jgi:hypothetical protein
MFGSALTSRSTPLWRSSCLITSHPQCQSQERRSRRRSGHHRRPPDLRRLRCPSPVPVPSMAQPTSRLDPAVLGLHITAGDPAPAEPAGKTATPSLRKPIARDRQTMTAISSRNKTSPHTKGGRSGWWMPAAGRQNRVMGRRAGAWTWSKVSTIHGNRPAHGSACDGEIRSYRFRHYASSDSSYERCIGLTWCSTCREYSGAMVPVPRGEYLPDALADLPRIERERPARTEVKLLDYLDRLARRGAWPPR